LTLYDKFRPPALVATTICWRLPRAFNQRPITSSLTPPALPGAQLLYNIGGVQKVAACFDEGVHNSEAGRFVGGPAPLHGTQAQGRDLQARTAQVAIVHYFRSFVLLGNAN